MTGSPAEKVDPAHWVSMMGGAVMLTVVVLCSMSLRSPWWSEHKELPGRREATEVSLWVLYTRYELQQDVSTLNCAKQCDFTKIGSAKVRETSAMWSDVCAKAPVTPEMATTCQRLMIARVGALLCWFFALLYSAMATLNFCGAGFPSSFRVPSACKLGLALCCIIACIMALIIGSTMDVRLSPTPPGTDPRVPRLPPQKVGFSGLGFVCIVVSLVLSVIGSVIAYCSQNIQNHMDMLEDQEAGRALADTNQDKAPPLWHQIGKAPKHRTPAKFLGKPEKVFTLDGHWGKGDRGASIEGSKLTWTSGVVVQIQVDSQRSFSYFHQGVDASAQVEDDGKLHWDDGDVWLRLTEEEHNEPPPPQKLPMGTWMT